MSATGAINLELWLGDMIASAAPASVMKLLHEAEVTQVCDGPSTFKLSFRMDRESGNRKDFDLLTGGKVKPWTRVLVRAQIGLETTSLIDGFVTAQSLSHDSETGASTLTVTGEDVSVIMDRLQLSLEYPEMGDGVIAELVLAKYTMIGILPEVTPTPLDLVPQLVEHTPQQNDTDRAFLTQMAQRNGYRFSVQPGTVPMTNIANWGPPKNSGSAQKPLSVDLESATNVRSVQFSLDAAAPVQMLGMVQDDLTEEDLPIATVMSTRSPALATNPALDALGLMQRRDLYTDARHGYLNALNDVQVVTDTSSQGALRAQGKLSTSRYGAVLQAPGLVDLRGAGASFDGRYRVEQVVHSFARGKYDQDFTLAREGTGSTISEVAA